MPANTVPIFPNVTVSVPTAFANADGTTIKSIYTPTGTNGARVDSINVTNTDTNAYTLNIYLRKSATNYLIGTVTIPISAGNSITVPPVNILAALAALSPALFVKDPAGNTVLYLDVGSSLYAGVTGTITAAKTVAVVVLGGEY